MKHILIVDDNRDLSDGLALLLEDNFDVCVVYNGSDALKKVESEDFDIIFLDVDLPDMNGIEVYRQLSELKPDIKIIIMTGYRIEQVVGKIIPEKEVGINNSFLYREDYAAAINYAGTAGMSFIYPRRPDEIILIEKILVEQGRNAIVAKTKDDALSGAYSGSYDMLVLDLNKPIICALDIYLTLKESDVLLPIVMLIKAGSDSVQDADLLRSFEITGCIFKPYDFERFFDLIQNAEIQNCA